MLKKILATTVASLCLATPGMARVEDGTRPLIDTLEANGIVVTINGETCANGNHGSYSWAGFQRLMSLCPGHTVDADDHNTVRHETWHALQHCVNVARSTPENTPINDDYQELYQQAVVVLGEDIVQRIMRVYPEDHWFIEFEAFMAAELYTADELKQYFLNICTARTDV